MWDRVHFGGWPGWRNLHQSDHEGCHRLPAHLQMQGFGIRGCLPLVHLSAIQSLPLLILLSLDPAINGDTELDALNCQGGTADKTALQEGDLIERVDDHAILRGKFSLEKEPSRAMR